MKYTATSSGNGEFTFRIEDGEFKDISIRVGNLRYANSTLEYDFDVYGGEISDESVGEYITFIITDLFTNANELQGHGAQATKIFMDERAMVTLSDEATVTFHEGPQESPHEQQ
jgi:hypothetical protein